MTDTVCRLCGEKLPIKCLHFSNELAVKHGYCSWMCLSSDLGNEKALELLNEEGKKGRRGIEKY